MLEKREIERLANETNIDLDENETKYILDSINRQINHAKWLKLVNTDNLAPVEESIYSLYDDNKVAEDEIKLFENK